MNRPILNAFGCYIILMIMMKVTCNTNSVNICDKDHSSLEVNIETGDVFFAGTNSHASLILRNGNGFICQEYNLDNIGDDRERNSIDKYTICCSKEFLNDENELSMLAVAQLTRTRRLLSFLSDDWFIERIEVRANQIILFDYRFHSWTSPSTKLIFGATKINNTNYIIF